MCFPSEGWWVCVLNPKPTLQGINKLIFYTPGQRQEDAAAGLHALCVSDEVATFNLKP